MNFENEVRKWMKRMEFSEKSFLDFLDNVEKPYIREEEKPKKKKVML